MGCIRLDLFKKKKQEGFILLVWGDDEFVVWFISYDSDLGGPTLLTENVKVYLYDIQ